MYSRVYCILKTLALITVVIAILVSGLFIAAPKQEHPPQIEEWFSQAKDVFSNAAEVFSFRQDETLPEADEDLNLKMEALLPEPALDLSYNPESNTPVIQDVSLLPDLFKAGQKKPSAQFKGQVHTDENDNIIGAEVQVAIPTN